MRVTTLALLPLLLSLGAAWLCFSPRSSSPSRSTALFATEVTVTNLDNGQTIKIEAGAPLSLAAYRSGMRLSFQCKQGTCKSCTPLLDGKAVDTCRTKVPEKSKVTLQKKPRL